jgi:hypothetical protein
MATANLLMLNFDPYFHRWFRLSLIRFIEAHRKTMAKQLKKDPSWGKRVEAELPRIYEFASVIAAYGIARRAEVMPKKCPYTFKQILSPKFLPKEESIPFKSWQPKNGLEILSDIGESGFHISRLQKKKTKLPMQVWALEKFISNRICTIAVARSHKNKVNIGDAVLVSVSKSPRIIDGSSLKEKDWIAVKKFIQNNIGALRRHWNGKTSTIDLLEELNDVHGRPIIERAHIGKFRSKHDHLEVWVWKGYCDKPTFRLKNLTRKYEAILRVENQEVERFYHESNRLKRVPKEDMAAMKKFFSSQSKLSPKITNWEALCMAWRSVNYKRRSSL